MSHDCYSKERTALLFVDPYNDFLSEGGKLWALRDMGRRIPSRFRAAIGRYHHQRTGPKTVLQTPISTSSSSSMGSTRVIDERPDGVHLSYDRMASLLAPYGSAEALAVARDLDSKIENLLPESA